MSDALVMQAASRIMHQNTLNRLKQIANGEEIKSDGDNKNINENSKEILPNKLADE